MQMELDLDRVPLCLWGALESRGWPECPRPRCDGQRSSEWSVVTAGHLMAGGRRKSGNPTRVSLYHLLSLAHRPRH